MSNERSALSWDFSDLIVRFGLTEIVAAAQADDGVSLPTLGSAGLAEVARLVGARMDQLTRIAERAVAAGDRRAARRITQAVLRADPGNAQARTVQLVIEEAGPFEELTGSPTVEPAGPSVDAELAAGQQGVVVLQGDLQGNAPLQIEGVPAEVGSVVDNGLLGEVARDGVFLDEVEQHRRVFAEMLSKEIQNIDFFAC